MFQVSKNNFFVLKQVAYIVITDALYYSEKEKRQQTK